MTRKTVIYRYLKKKGYPVKVAYAMAEELDEAIELQTSIS